MVPHVGVRNTNSKDDCELWRTTMGSKPSDDDDGLCFERVLREMRQSVIAEGCELSGVEDATLLRFLKARSINVAKASKMFVAHQKWRASFVPYGFIPDSQVANELEQGKLYLLREQSMQGWPIAVVLLRKHEAAKRDLEECKRFIVHALDKILASFPEGRESSKMMVILDLQGLSHRNVDIRVCTAGFEFLQNYYPERLGKLYMVNVPDFFKGVWKIIGRFVDPETRRKIVFVDRQKTAEILQNDIDCKVLPAKYGGQAELVLLQDVKLDSWPPQL